MRQRLVAIGGSSSAEDVLLEAQRVALSGEMIVDVSMTHAAGYIHTAYGQNSNREWFSAMIMFGLPDNEPESWLAVPKHEHGVCSICGTEDQFWTKCNRCGSVFATEG